MVAIRIGNECKALHLAYRENNDLNQLHYAWDSSILDSKQLIWVFLCLTLVRPFHKIDSKLLESFTSFIDIWNSYSNMTWQTSNVQSTGSARWRHGAHS